jgi:hypothetical protein
VAAFLMLGAAARAASWLLDTLRHSLMRADIACMQFYTLRICVIKNGGWAREHLHGLHGLHALPLHLASSHPSELLWHLFAARFTLRE